MSTAAEQSQDDFMPPFARAIAPYWVLAVVLLATYINIFGNGFLFDDNLLIELNTYLRDWGHIGYYPDKIDHRAARISWAGFIVPCRC